MAQPWVGVQKLAVVPTFNRQFDTTPPPSDWDNQIMRRVLYDPDPVSGIDRSLRAYIGAISYGRATLDVKLFPHAFSDGPGVVEAAWQSLPPGHGYPYVLCVIPLYDGDVDRKGWFTTVGQNGVAAVSRVAMDDRLARRTREITGVWAMEVLHAIARLPDLYNVSPPLGDFDNMTFNSGTHSCSYLKQAAGWLDGGAFVTQTARHGQHDLHSIGLSAPPPGRVSAVRIKSLNTGHTFYVEARLKSDVYEKGFAPLSSGANEFRGLPGEAVIVYETVPGRLDQTFLRGALSVGQTYSNAAEDISVTVTGAIDGGMSVRVTAPDPCPALLQQIQELQQDLDNAADVNERKRILQEIGALRKKAQQLGCH